MKKLMKSVPVLTVDPTTHEFVQVMSAYDGPLSVAAFRGVNKKFLEAHNAGKFYPLSPEDAYQEMVQEAEKAADKIAAGLVLTKAKKAETYVIGAAKLKVLNLGKREVARARTTYRAVEERTVGKGAVGEDGFDIDNHNGAEDCPDKMMCDISGDPCEESVPAGTPSTAQGLVDCLHAGTPTRIRGERALNHLSELCERILCTDRKVGEDVVLAFAADIVCDCDMIEAARLAQISKTTFYRKWPLWCAWARAAAKEQPANGKNCASRVSN